MASFTSKATLGVAIVGTVGIIGYVHWKQWADREDLHKGVIKDIERQQKRKIENIYWLEQQANLRKILKSQETRDDTVSNQLLEKFKEK